jgi:hypothetical protein
MKTDLGSSVADMGRQQKVNFFESFCETQPH